MYDDYQEGKALGCLMQNCPLGGWVGRCEQMGLSMAARREVTKAAAVRYAQSSRKEKQVLLDELCRLAGWHRDNARKALRAALRPPRPRRVRWKRECPRSMKSR